MPGLPGEEYLDRREINDRNGYDLRRHVDCCSRRNGDDADCLARADHPELLLEVGDDWSWARASPIGTRVDVIPGLPYRVGPAMKYHGIVRELRNPDLVSSG